jgi:LPXTG-motif cell wall-anchored protein
MAIPTETGSAFVDNISSNKRSAPTAAPTATPTEANQNENSGGISTGPIVGIVVGSVAFLLLVGALLFLRRRKQAQKKIPTNSDSDTLPEYVESMNVKNNHTYAPVTPKSPMETTTDQPTGLFQPQPTVAMGR